jgi:hypothetical protein
MSAEALHGDLRLFFPSEVLQLLQLAQATGRLELERAEERAEIYIERGRPVFARTSGATVRSGQILVHRGAVTSEVLDEALALQRERPGQRLGALLVEIAAARPEQVRQAVQESLLRIVYGVLLWREGTFRFVPGSRAEQEDVTLDLDLDRLILEGLRHGDEAGVRRDLAPPS